MTDHLTPSERALREAAEKATQGEWRQHLVDETTVVSNSRLVDVCCTAPADYGTDEQVDYETDAEQCEANAAYIVAAQPGAVLALLAEIERLRGVLSLAETALTDLGACETPDCQSCPRVLSQVRAALTPKEATDA